MVNLKEPAACCGLRGCVQQAHAQAGVAGVKAAVCEMPFARISSDVAGGAGGTCVLRGCVPKKLMVYGGEFAQAFKDSVGFGCAPVSLLTGRRRSAAGQSNDQQICCTTTDSMAHSSRLHLFRHAVS